MPNKSTHLGDGAYVTHTGYDYLLTANHHEPDLATDKITLDLDALRRLMVFVEACETPDHERR